MEPGCISTCNACEGEGLFRGAVAQHRDITPLNGTAHTALDVPVRDCAQPQPEHLDKQTPSASESELKFLSFLSHDLANSLSGVRLALTLLAHRLGQRNEYQEERTLLEDAQGAIADTIHGMRQLLEHERVRKAEVKPEMRAVRLADLMSGLARQFAAEAERMGLHLTVDVPAKAVVHTDSVLVSIVLRNLIGNAIKYSSNGTVRMTGERRNCGASGSSRWVLAVSDEGPGIRTGGREHLFEAFRRGDVHGEEGVGLGLAIASKAAKLLGAELTVESEIGIGSTFALAFPPER